MPLLHSKQTRTMSKYSFFRLAYFTFVLTHVFTSGWLFPLFGGLYILASVCCVFVGFSTTNTEHERVKFCGTIQVNTRGGLTSAPKGILKTYQKMYTYCKDVLR